MFLENSRYAKISNDEVKTRAGRKVTAIRLRRLPQPSGDFYVSKQDDRLDLLAQKRFGDGTRFWHIADANTRLEAKTLLARTLDTLKVPRS